MDWTPKAWEATPDDFKPMYLAERAKELEECEGYSARRKRGLRKGHDVRKLIIGTAIILGVNKFVFYLLFLSLIENRR